MKSNSLPDLIRFVLGGGSQGTMSVISSSLGSGKTISALAALTGMIGGLATINSTELIDLASVKRRTRILGTSTN